MDQTQTMPAFTPGPVQPGASTKHPWDDDQAFKDLLAATGRSCPGADIGDYAFVAWLYNFYLGAKATQPAAAPVVNSFTPTDVPANADATLTIDGTGFDAGATVVLGPSTLSPSANSPTQLTVTVPAADIATAGSVTFTVKNSDGQTSAAQTLTVT
jgi:hypothetical protein